MSRVAWALAAWLIFGGASLAQPERPAPDQDRAALRQRLERRLGEMDRIRGRLESAIKQLDSGAPIESVRDELFPQGGGRRPDRGGDAGVQDRQGGRDPRPEVYGPPDPEAERRMVLRFLDEHDAAGAERMRQVLKDRPEDGQRWVGRTAVRVRAILEERDEELRRLRTSEFTIGRRAVDAARRVADALGAQPPDTRAVQAAQAELEAALGEQFDLRLRLHTREIAVLEERLRTLKADLSMQEGKRESSIKDGAERILRATREWSERARRPEDGDRPPQR